MTDQINLRRLATQQLESLARSGVTHLPRVAARKAQRTNIRAPVEATTIAPATVDVAPPAAKLSREDRAAALTVLQQEVAGCTRCAMLAETRTQTVFGVGNITPRLVFMGEAPGADEDRQGIPFVGRAGQLLTKIIEACTFRRDDVYILNTLKCRPPENRNPEPDEVQNCRGFFERQIDLLQPEFICCLGGVAAKSLLNTDLAIGKLRKRFHDYRGIPVLCTYHPSYLLRNPDAKRDVWEDMQLLMQRLGIVLPGKG